MFKSSFEKICGFIFTVSLGLCSLSVFAESAFAEDAADNASTGMVVGQHIFGLARDFQNDPLLIDETPLIYEQSAYEFDLGHEGNVFRVSLFDHAIAGAYLSELADENGKLFDTNSLDFGSVGGVSSVGAAIESAWNTVLFSESTLVDANSWAEFKQSFKFYFKNKADLVEPYNHGWLNEVILLDKNGSAKAIKNYTAGRTFASNIIAMPDAKTFYLHDSEHSGNLYMFVSDEANSFSKGTLYAMSRTSDEPIQLGASSALKMKFKLKKSTFDSFYKKHDASGGACESGFTFIQTVYGAECLMPQKKNKKYAGQFEPIRTAALKGVVPFSDVGDTLSIDRHTGVIKLTHNSGQVSQFSFTRNETIGTEYFIQKEG